MEIKPYDGFTLSANQLKVLRFLQSNYDSWGEGPIYRMKYMADELRIEERLVRLACRALKRKGLADLEQLYSEDKGFCGSGYMCSKLGNEVIERMEEYSRVLEEAKTL